MDPAERSRDARTLLSNAGRLLGGDGGALALRLVQTLIIARAFGAARFGTLAMILASVTLVGKLVDFRIWETVTKWVVEYRSRGEADKAKATVKLALFIDIGSAGVAFALTVASAPLAARFFPQHDSLADGITLYAWMLLLTAHADTARALARVASLYTLAGAQSFGVAAVRLGAVLWVLARGSDLREVLVALLVGSALELVASVWLSRAAVRALELSGFIRVPLSCLREDRRRLGRYLAFTNGNALLKLMQRELDVVIVGGLVSSEMLGAYSLARAITDAMRFIAVPIYVTSFPTFARLWGEGAHARLRALFHSTLRASLAVAVVALLFVGLLSGPLVRAFFAPAYAAALPVLLWLAVGTAIEIATAVLQPLFMAAERPGAVVTAIAASSAARVVAIVLLVAHFGAVGAGMAHVLSVAVWVLVALMLMRSTYAKLEAASSM